jgi:hypothetical protein
MGKPCSVSDKIIKGGMQVAGGKISVYRQGILVTGFRPPVNGYNGPGIWVNKHVQKTNSGSCFFTKQIIHHFFRISHMVFHTVCSFCPQFFKIIFCFCPGAFGFIF